MVYFIVKGSRDSRSHDLAELEKDYRTADPKQRELINKTAQKIMHESKATRDMREALVREHRKGATGNIKDIHEIVKNNGNKYH